MLTYFGKNDVKYVYDPNDHAVIHITMQADLEDCKMITVALPIKDIQKIAKLCQVLDSN